MSNENKVMIIENPFKLTLNEIRVHANALMTSPKFRKKFECVEDAIVAAQHGQDLDLPITVAWNHVHVINGNAGISAQIMLALIKRKVPNFRMQIIDHSRTIAKIKVWADYINERELYSTFEYTIEDAKLAGDYDKKGSNYKRIPRQMIWARVISEMSRCCHPDIINGLFTPEELEFFDNPKELTPPQKVKREISIKKNQQKIKDFKEGVVDEKITDEEIAKTNETLKTPAEKRMEAYKKAKGLGMKLDSGMWELEYYSKEIEWTPKKSKDLEDIKEIKPSIQKALNKIEKMSKDSETNALDMLSDTPKKKTKRKKSTKKKTSKSTKTMTLDERIKQKYAELDSQKRDGLTLDDYKKIYLAKIASGELKESDI